MIALCKGCKEIEYVLSVDDQSYVEGSQEIAIKNLERSGYYGMKEFLIMSSLENKFREFVKDKRFDMCHIDGNHDKPGVLKDLELSLSCLDDKGIIFVHDMDYILDVKSAVDEFVETNKLGMIKIEMYRGGVILQRR